MLSGDPTGGHAQYPEAVDQLGAVCEDGEPIRAITDSRTCAGLAEVEGRNHQAERPAWGHQPSRDTAVVPVESTHGDLQEPHGGAEAEGQENGLVHRAGPMGISEMVADEPSLGARHVQEPAADVGHHEADRGAQGHGDVGNCLGFPFQAAFDAQHARGYGGSTAGCEFPEGISQSVLRQIGAADGTGVLADGALTDSQGRVQTIGSGDETGRARSVRTLILRNTANYCYANSAIRTVLWAVAMDSRLERLLTNIGRNLIRGLLAHKGRSILVAGHILYGAVFRGWRSPSRQHDYSEFLTHLIMHIGPDLCAGRWEARRQQACPRRGSVVVRVDRGICQQAISLGLPDGNLHHAQSLLQNWHAQARVHALVQAPTILVVSFSRYGGSLGVGCKNACRIAWGDVVSVPTFSAEDAIVTEMTECQVIAVVMRHGDSVDSGHYTTRLVEVDGHVLCDDNEGPIYQARHPSENMQTSRHAYMLICKYRGGAGGAPKNP